MVSELDVLFREMTQEDSEVQGDSLQQGSLLSQLPLVMCGPILRKVHYGSVSVWLAFKEEVSDIKLYVFEASDPTSIGKGTLRFSENVKAPLKIGKNVFVTLITAQSTSVRLKPDVVYGYQIFFTHQGVQKQLGYKGVLKGGSRSISYAPYLYPTFCLPSDTLDNVKIVHGSCRKPHGGRTDALRALDTVLELNSMNVKERPQILCLTGDQIYSDDVSDLLLFKIIKAKDELFGWKETLPKNYAEDQLRPGNRKAIIAKSGNKTTRLRRLFPFLKSTQAITSDDLTTTDSKSHLIFLSEFILMYMFTFSDAFLTTAGWPEFKQLYKEPKDTEERRRKILSYQVEKAHLNSFVHCLRFVKKALANVSTLMVFDDHEITDDWFITKEWAEVALRKGTTSRRYIFNGMLAYALFQDWGNDHTKYSSGDGQKILTALQANNTLHYPNKFSNEAEALILPKLVRNQSRSSNVLESNFRWDYKIDYNSFTLLVLNTRTQREYYDKESGRASLIKDFPVFHARRDTNKLLILVSAAPVFGNLEMELGQEELSEGKSDVLMAAASRIGNKVGPYETDLETWAISSRGLSKLLVSLSTYQKVLILSGDVHYAYTAYVRLWRKNPNDSYHMTEIVQSTSSALKNSTGDTHYPAINKYGLEPKSGEVYKRIKVMGRKRIDHAYEENDNPTFQDPQTYNPRRTRIPLDSVTVDPVLQYTVRYMRSTTPNFIDPMFKRIGATLQSQSFPNAKKVPDVSLTVVGKDNVSVLSFAHNRITNSIWFANGNKTGPDDAEAYQLLYPLVQHKVVLNSNFNEAELPVRDFQQMAPDKAMA